MAFFKPQQRGLNGGDTEATPTTFTCFKVKLTVGGSGEGDGVAMAKIIAFVMILCVQSGTAW